MPRRAGSQTGDRPDVVLGDHAVAGVPEHVLEQHPYAVGQARGGHSAGGQHVEPDHPSRRACELHGGRCPEGVGVHQNTRSGRAPLASRCWAALLSARMYALADASSTSMDTACPA